MKSSQRRRGGSKRWTCLAALAGSLALVAPVAFAAPGNGNGPPTGFPGNGNGPPAGFPGNGNGPPNGWPGNGNGGPPGRAVPLSVFEDGLLAVAIVSVIAGARIVRAKQKRSSRSGSDKPVD